MKNLSVRWIVIAGIGFGVIAFALMPYIFPKHVEAPTLAEKHPPTLAVLPPGPDAKPGTPLDLRAAIQAGLKALDRRSLDESKCFAAPQAVLRHGRKTGRVVQIAGLRKCVGDYLLAVADENGRIKIVEAYEHGASNGYIVNVEGHAKRRGVNVPFNVKSPPNRTVVGLKTAVPLHEGGAEEAMYVPYSSGIDTPEIRRDGLTYLESIVADAMGDLEAKKVPSRYQRGRLVSQVVEIQQAATLVLTEQMKSDQAFVNGTQKERQAMVNRALTILGANLQNACEFTKSRVGAAGIAQLMPKSYRDLRAAYPAAKLPKDPDSRFDHTVAIETMILHSDNEWWAVRTDPELSARLRNDAAARRLMLAAGYNASAKTVVDAMRACGDGWVNGSCPQLPLETVRYLVKFQSIWGMLYPT